MEAVWQDGDHTFAHSKEKNIVPWIRSHRYIRFSLRTSPGGEQFGRENALLNKEHLSNLDNLRFSRVPFINHGLTRGPSTNRLSPTRGCSTPNRKKRSDFSRILPNPASHLAIPLGP